MLLYAMSSAAASNATTPIDPTALSPRGDSTLEMPLTFGGGDRSFSEALTVAKLSDDVAARESDQTAGSDRHAQARKRPDTAGADGAPVPLPPQIQTPSPPSMGEETRKERPAASPAHASTGSAAVEDGPLATGAGRAMSKLGGRHVAAPADPDVETAAARRDADKAAPSDHLPDGAVEAATSDGAPGGRTAAPGQATQLPTSDAREILAAALRGSANRRGDQGKSSDGSGDKGRAGGMAGDGLAASQVSNPRGQSESVADASFSGPLKWGTSAHDLATTLARGEVKYTEAGLLPGAGWPAMTHGHGVPAAQHQPLDPAGQMRDPPGDATFLSPIAEGVVVRQAALQANQSGSSFRVVLQPETLGVVAVHVARDDSGLVVTLAPQQPETQLLLDKHLPELVAMLSTTGSSVQANVVHAGATHTSSLAHPDATMAHHGRGASADAGSGQPFSSRERTGGQEQWQGHPPLDDARRDLMPRGGEAAERRAGDRSSLIDLQA